MALQQHDIDYFNRSQAGNPRHWARLGGKPDFRGATVLDLGCEHGSLCIDIAQSGTRRVIGVDLNTRLITFANENLKLNYPQYAGTVEYRLQDLGQVPESGFDYIISKDTFEHIIGLEQVLAEIKKRLRPGGYLYTGFGPLWKSAYGAHRRMRMPIPWGHTILPERLLVQWRNLFYAQKATTINELGLNALSLAEYLRIFRSSGMAITSLQFNVSESRMSHLFSLIRKVPFLKEYFTHKLYCIMQKQSE